MSYFYINRKDAKTPPETAKIAADKAKLYANTVI